MKEIITILVKIVGFLIERYELREGVKSRFHGFYQAFSGDGSNLYDDYESLKKDDEPPKKTN